jgi:hypothetical protein
MQSPDTLLSQLSQILEIPEETLRQELGIQTEELSLDHLRLTVARYLEFLNDSLESGAEPIDGPGVNPLT